MTVEPKPSPGEIEQRVLEIVASALDLESGEVELDSRLMADLGAESLDFLDISFLLERAFRIRMPRTDLLQRGSEFFGEDALVSGGKLTDFGLALVRGVMPELPAGDLAVGMRAADLRGMISPLTFVRLVNRLLDVKAAVPRDCPDCGGSLDDSPIAPELACAACDNTIPLPDGDEVLLQDLVEIASRLPVSPASSAGLEPTT